MKTTLTSAGRKRVTKQSPVVGSLCYRGVVRETLWRTTCLVAAILSAAVVGGDGGAMAQGGAREAAPAPERASGARAVPPEATLAPDLESLISGSSTCPRP